MDDLLGVGKLFEALERGSREFRELAKTYLEPIVKEKGKLKAAEIRGRRRIFTVTQRAGRMLTRAGIKKRRMNEKVVIPIFQYAYRETEEELIDRWAGLLASSAAGGMVHVSFPQILSQLTAGEAHILDKLFVWSKEEQEPSEVFIPTRTHERLKNETGLTEDAFSLAIENLYRLRLCEEFRGESSLFWRSGTKQASWNSPAPNLTILGEQFIRVCQGPKKNKL